ncbi:MAG: hypothetical protein M3O62_07070 [Pseudomonadota bacterium]|nr:hypothetical protein [Pseudomonadota bacterium]
MARQDLTPEQALQLHRGFLQEILADVMRVMSVGVASDERLIAGLEMYWEACLSRRDKRRAVLDATMGSASEHAVEPMGKPFLMMARGELLPRRGKLADQVALHVYDEARNIAVSEALTGVRDTARRQALIALIRA